MRPPDAADPSEAAPILSRKRHAEPSVFTPAALLHQARRQKALAARPVPAICVLDPDGDLVAHLERTGRAVAERRKPIIILADVFKCGKRQHGLPGKIDIEQ